jgi:hypothetical protein
MTRTERAALLELITAVKPVKRAAAGMADHSPGWSPALACPELKGRVVPRQRNRCRGRCGLHDGIRRLERALKRAERQLAK